MGRPLSEVDLATLGKAPLLSEISPARRETVIAAMTIVEAGKRQALFAEGDPASECYVVLEGWVRLYRTDRSGAEADVGLFGPGQSFAEAVMFLGGRFPASAQAVEPSRLARLPIAKMRRLLQNDTELAIALLGSLSMHLHRLVGRLSGDRLHSAERRLCEYLLMRSEPNARESAIRLPFDKTVLAGALGMAPEALSRAFAALRPLGVRSEGRDIIISDRNAVARHLG